MSRTALLAGAVLGFLGVALGAFGAHALEDVLLKNGYVETYETGTRYHLVHALLLVLMGWIAGNRESRWLRIGIYAGIFGVVIFAGTLYLLSVFNLKWMGAITPIGGLGLMLAWIGLFIHVITTSKNK